MNGLMTSAAVLLEDRTPLDLVLYRPLIFWARLKGAWRFLRGDHGWHTFERNARPAGA